MVLALSALTSQADIGSNKALSNTSVSFEKWKSTFKQEAISSGIKPLLFDKIFQKLIPDPVVIKLDTNQPEFTRNIWDYIDNATSSPRIKRGKAQLLKYRKFFDKLETQYGVQREIIVAIWAMESDFGRNYGNQNVVRSLATLAHNARSEKREIFAKSELISALHIIQDYRMKAGSLIGSWAGAMGQPQFMPSSYVKYSIDYNGDGKRDIWKTEADVFASIANFLKQSGWRRLEDWGVEVNLPRDFDWKLNSSAYELRFVQWRSIGVINVNGKSFNHPQRLASTFIPAGRFGPTFLIAHNFNIIKKYNKSLSYTLAVAQLSRLLAGGDSIRIAWPRIDKPLSTKQIKEIQTLLNKKNHNAGIIDGKVGSKTREAVRTWQLENGFAGDGYINLDLLKKLKQKG